MYTIYYLLHWESKRRLRPYKTQAGARIACRLRNQHLGFKLRLERRQAGTREYELYRVENTTVRGTYCIESARVTTLELFTELGANNDKAQ
jgi:hypothetical protein